MQEKRAGRGQGRGRGQGWWAAKRRGAGKGRGRGTAKAAGAAAKARAMRGGVNAALTGDYLTTTGTSVKDDIALIKKLGFHLDQHETAEETVDSFSG